MSNPDECPHARLRSARVAVIGAGLSDLACANALTEPGFRVNVFDEGRAPGGRTSTRRAEMHGFDLGFDHGAQYFTVRDPKLAELVARWEAIGVVERWYGRIAVLGTGGVVESYSRKPRFVGTPTMSAVCRHLASNQDVRCDATVDRLERQSLSVGLFDSRGDSLGEFDVAVSSAASAQTAALLSAVAPNLAVEAASVIMKPCWAVMAAFERRLPVSFDGAFINEGPLSWVARTSSKPSCTDAPDRWVLHANAEWSVDHLEETPEAVTQALLDRCFKAMGLQKQAPIWLKAHRWRYALADNPLDEGCLFDASTRIGACGDWANGNRVEGALLSGFAAARRIEDALTGCETAGLG